MIIEHFVPKSQYGIEAVEFTGGIDNGREVMVWIINGGGMAEWREEYLGDQTHCGLREHIRIIKGGGVMCAYPGDYIYKDEKTGEYKTQRRVVIEAKYDRVSSLTAVA